MAIDKALLLIADIGGYTRFMKEHRFGLSHAQDTIAQLLEAVIDASGRFKLAKLEGDAAFFYVVGEGPASLAEEIAAIRRAFLARRQQLVIDRMCVCDGCTQAGSLTLKFVTHSGEVAFQKVKQFTELAGVDVILVHRMLKNDVPEDLPFKQVVQRLEKSFEVFFLIPDQGRRKYEGFWRNHLGNRVIFMDSPDDTCHVAAGLVALNEGAVQSVDAFAARLSRAGMGGSRVQGVLNALTPWSKDLKRAS